MLLSGLWLETVDQTHLVLASGKLVLQKHWLSDIEARAALGWRLLGSYCWLGFVHGLHAACNQVDIGKFITPTDGCILILVVLVSNSGREPPSNRAIV